MKNSLNEAIKDDDVDKLAQYVQNVDDINAQIQQEKQDDYLFSNNPPLLSIACYYGSFKCVQYLISHGSDISAADQVGRLPVHYVSWGGSDDVRGILDDLGANFHVTDRLNNNSLHYACMGGHYDLVRLFWMRGFSLTEAGQNLNYPIHFACQSGNPELVKFLCDNNVDLNVVNSAKETPLLIVLNLGNHLMLRYLIDHGVRTDIFQRDNMTPLMCACRSNFKEVASILLENLSEDVNKQDPLGWAAIHYAAEAGALSICQKLVEKNASINIMTKFGMTATHLAANRNHQQVVEFLKSNGGVFWTM